jgi:carbonic anhydrase
MIFGQGFNDLFVIRVAGNVLGDVCVGSVDFALSALSESVRVVVMLGHSGCGAVTAAVDAYLSPLKFWSKSISPNLRSLTQRIFVSVREAANGFKEVWGPDAANVPGYREALIEAAVCINAAQSAFDLRQEVERSGKWEIEVLYGVHNIRNHQVCMPVDPAAVRADENVRLAQAPTNPKEFHALAVQMAEILKSRDSAPTTHAKPGRPSSRHELELDRDALILDRDALH